MYYTDPVLSGSGSGFCIEAFSDSLLSLINIREDCVLYMEARVTLIMLVTRFNNNFISVKKEKVGFDSRAGAFMC